MRKPVQVYLSEEERKDLVKVKEALGKKTLSGTIKKVLEIFKSINSI